MKNSRLGPKPQSNKQTKIPFFKRGINLQRGNKRGEVHIGGFELNTVYVLFSTRYIFTLSPRSHKIDYSNFILARVFREFEVIINDCTESGFLDFIWIFE